MANRLFLRGGIYHARFYDAEGKRQQRSTKCTDKQAAEAILRRWERRAADPAYHAAHETTLDDALRNMLRDRGLKGRADGTLQSYRVKAGHWVRILGSDCTLHQIDAKAVDKFIGARLDEGASRNTVHKELTVLRATLKVAKRRGEYVRDIQAVMPEGFSPEYKPRERFLSALEAQALLAELVPDRSARVAFILSTGARLKESESAHVVDVDLARCLVRLRGTKTKKAERFVPIVGYSYTLLEHAVRYAEGENGKLFRPWPNIRRDLEQACKRAGIPKCSPNDLRRTCGTWLRQHQVEPHLIGAVLGHTDSRMVERVYGRMPVQSLGRALTTRLQDTATNFPAAEPLIPHEQASAELRIAPDPCSVFVTNASDLERKVRHDGLREPQLFSNDGSCRSVVGS
jgi:integrase